MADLFAQAVAAYKAGDSKQARTQLQALLKTNPAHENGWLLMSQVVSAPAQREQCLKQVLQLNPKNQLARQALESPQAFLALDSILDTVPEPAPPRQSPSRSRKIHPRIYIPPKRKKPKPPPKLPALKTLDLQTIAQAKFSLEGTIRYIVAQVHQIAEATRTNFAKLQKSEQFTQNVGCGGMVAIIALAIGCAFIEPISATVGGVVLAVIFWSIIAFRKSRIADRKGNLNQVGSEQAAVAETLFETIKDDVAPERQVVAQLDLTNSALESKKVKEKKSPSSWPVKYYRDDWLMTYVRLLDGNKLRLRLTERFKVKLARKESPASFRYQMRVTLKIKSERTLSTNPNLVLDYMPTTMYRTARQTDNKIKLILQQSKPFTRQDIARVVQGLYFAVEKL